MLTLSANGCVVSLNSFYGKSAVAASAKKDKKWQWVLLVTLILLTCAFGKNICGYNFIVEMLFSLALCNQNFL
jgi:hypothetical protein